MPGGDIDVSCRVRRHRRNRGQALGRHRGRPGSFSLHGDGEGRSAAPVGREVENRERRLASRNRGNRTRVRAGEVRHTGPGRMAGSVPELAYGTIRSRLGRVRVRVRGLRDGDHEEREGDRDRGECVHALPDPPRINPVGHQLSRSASRTSARPRSGTSRYADRECVVASYLHWNSASPAPALLRAADGQEMQGEG